MTLHLGPDLDLPDKFATEGVVAVGMRGSGKSNTLVRWAEVLSGAGIPFVAVDPKGDWWGIRSSADGKAPGLSVPVFGGLHGDGPLTEGMGPELADLLVDLNISAVLDVSVLSKSAIARFLTGFCDRLMARHQAEPHVRCVLLEEAHRYIPQVVPGGPVARCKEACSAILLEGRAFGLGCWAATQRAARLHKDVMEEVSTVVLHRIGAAASNDLKTVAGWVKHEELGDEIVPSLTKLEDGEAWWLSPSFGVARRVRVDRRTTFDSASTPLVGAGSRPVLTLADIDMAAIKDALKESIEKAKENDPADLRRRAQLAESLAEQRAKELDRLRVLLDERDAALAELTATPLVAPGDPFVPPVLLDLRDEMLEHARGMIAALGRIGDEIDAALMESPPEPPHAISPTATFTPADVYPIEELNRLAPTIKTGTTIVSVSSRPAVALGDNAESRVLAVLARHGDRTPRQVAFQAGISPKSSTLRGAFAALRKAGWIEPGQPIRLTAAGRAAAADVPALPGGRALLDYWRGWFGTDNAERRVLDALVDAYPEALDVEDLCAITGISPGSSTLRGALAALRKVGLCEPKGRRMGDEFMAAIRG